MSRETSLPGETVGRLEDEAGMWADLRLARQHAESAPFEVTRRAELFMRVAGLPLARVLDALNIDEAGWREQVAALRDWEAQNRAAWRSLDSGTAAASEATS